MSNEPLTSNELFVQARDLLRKIAGETDPARMEVNAWEAMELSRKMRAADELPQQASKEQVVVHYGPVYYPPPSRGESMAACRPGPEASTLTTHKPWVTCQECKQAEAYKNAT